MTEGELRQAVVELNNVFSTLRALVDKLQAGRNVVAQLNCLESDLESAVAGMWIEAVQDARAVRTLAKRP